MARDFARRFYASKEWAQVRKYALLRDRYLCQVCGRPALEVHHIRHLNPNNIHNPQITLNPSNLISLCKDCHFAQHEKDKREGQHRKSVAKHPGCADEYVFNDEGYLVKAGPQLSE